MGVQAEQHTNQSTEQIDRIAARIEFLREHVVRPYLEDLALLGLQRGPSAKSTIEETLQKFEMTLRRSEAGETHRAIARDLKLGERTVSDWVKGERLPTLLSFGSREIRSRRAYDFTPPRIESTSFAYLLGAYCGSVHSGHSIYHFRPEVGELEVAKRIAEGFESVVASKAKITMSKKTSRGDQPLYEVNCLSLPMSRHMNTVSAGNTRVPWEHLGTESERIAFLRGVFDLNSSVGVKQAKTLSVQKTKGEFLIVELAHVLMRVGIVPRVTTGKKAFLQINEVRDLRAFAERIGLTDPIQQQRLESIGSREVTRATYSADTYRRAKNYWMTNPQSTNEQVAKAINVTYDTIRSWRDRGVVPKEILRANELNTLLIGHEKQVDLICVLYREGGLSSAQSRDAASWATELQTREVLEMLKEESIEPRTNPELVWDMLANNNGASPEVDEIEQLTLPPVEINAPTQSSALPEELQGLVSFRDAILNGRYDHLEFMEPLRKVIEKAAQLHFPLLSFENFLQQLRPEQLALGRAIILASAPPKVAEEYREFLSDGGALSDNLNMDS